MGILSPKPFGVYEVSGPAWDKWTHLWNMIRGRTII